MKNKDYFSIVIDEAHGFVTDAAFNSMTENVLKFLILEVGRETRRIYLTATPKVVLEEIVKLENELTKRPHSGFDRLGMLKEEVWINAYFFKRDYSYIQPVFFENDEKVLNYLQKIAEDEKTVIFVKSKKQGMELLEKLGGSKATYIDAENKKNSEEATFLGILKENMFEKQFLIVTRFLDVGVNLKDLKIKNVVLFQWYEEDMLQMVGRKRMAEEEKLNVFIKVPKRTAIESERKKLEKDYEEMLREIENIEKNHNRFYTDLPFPLYFITGNDGMQISYNRFSLAVNRYHVQQLNKLLGETNDEMRFCKNFRKVILKYFWDCKEPKNLEKPDMEEIAEKEEIKLLLEPLLEQELKREQATEISEKIMEIFQVPRRNAQKGQIAISKIKEKFMEYEIPYKIENLSKSGKSGIWMVRRGYYD